MKQKTCVISGVSKGLGYALSEELCRANHIVFGCARQEGLAKQLLEKYPDHFFFSSVDITKECDLKAWKKQILADTNTIDIVINNASIVNARASCWELKFDEIQKLLDINLGALFKMIQVFLPLLIAQDEGLFINVSSGWGKVGEAGLAPYCASKFGGEGVVQSLAREVPDTIGVVSLDPGGGVQTDMLKACSPNYYKVAPSPQEWATHAMECILNLGLKDSGKHVVVW